MSVATELQRIIGAKADLKTAIEAKGVTVSSSALIDAYPALVNAIPSGGGETEKKDVNFYDYDGTRVASFSGSELQALTALPDAPDHTSDFVPLTFDEWNWTLAEIKTYNTAYPDAIISIGANYHTTDNRTHYVFYVPDNDYPYTVKFSDINNVNSIDWGDDSTELSDTHTYQGKGYYDCSFTKSTSNYFIDFKENSIVPQFIFWSSIFTNVGLSNFKGGVRLMSVPSTMTYFPNNLSYSNLLYLNTPRSVTNFYKIGSNGAQRRVILPGNLTTLLNGFYSYVYGIEDIIIPNGVTSISGNFCQMCNQNQQNLVIPNSVTTIGSSAFESVPLSSVTVPSSVTNIGSYGLYGARLIIMKATTPPTISSDTFSTGKTYKILVPYSADHSILNTYKAATNWSNFASKMEELPE